MLHTPFCERITQDINISPNFQPLTGLLSKLLSFTDNKNGVRKRYYVDRAILPDPRFLIPLSVFVDFVFPSLLFASSRYISCPLFSSVFPCCCQRHIPNRDKDLQEENKENASLSSYHVTIHHSSYLFSLHLAFHLLYFSEKQGMACTRKTKKNLYTNRD